jgi:putative flippase GtrA
MQEAITASGGLGTDGEPSGVQVVAAAGQFVRYLLSGSTAVATHLAVLIALTELAGMPSTFASAVGFACAVPVNYALQHRFVFKRTKRHLRFFTRYLAVTLLTLALNTGLFWLLTVVLGIFYVASQILTIGVVVLVNFVVNRSFTFAT